MVLSIDGKTIGTLKYYVFKAHEHTNDIEELVSLLSEYEKEENYEFAAETRDILKDKGYRFQ